MLIDTHTHLYLPEFSPEDGGHGPSDAVDRAVAAGVGHLILPNVDLATVEPMRELHSRRSDVTSMAMGLHPTEIGPSWRDDLARVVDILGAGDDYVAVGEIGVDLYWDKTWEEQQMMAFEQQVIRASELGLPVIIHCREALPQTLEVLEAFSGRIQGVMHSFGGTAHDVDNVRSKAGDFYFGINGIVTFKNSKLRNVLPEIGLDRMLLETDSPYLAPVPHRGKRNESSFLPHIAAHIAEHLEMDVQNVADATTLNAKSLFKI